MINIRIEELDTNSPHLNNVQDLADRNSKSLGFFPKQAFYEYASRRWILVALDGEKLAGYLLYRIVKTKNRATIVHLCIDTEYRGIGVAHKLFERLRLQTRSLYGIGLLCRRDYIQANKLWSKLGLIVKSEKRGRGEEPSTLQFWWYDHGHKTLFDVINIEKIKVVIDANVFFDFQNGEHGNRESLALISSRLESEVQFLITPELIEEINRNNNNYIRTKYRKKANEFSLTQDDIDQFDEICTQLRSIFPSNLSENTLSDLKQVAWAIVDSDVSFFVTRDENLLDLSQSIFNQFGLSVIRPVDLILHLDELYKVEEYRHMRLAGTNISLRRIQKQEHDGLGKYFNNDLKKETVSRFLEQLRQYLLDSEIKSCFVVEDEKSNPVLLFVLDKSVENQLIIPIFRVSKASDDNKKLIRYILLYFLTSAFGDKRSFVKITDNNLPLIVQECLAEDAFIYSPNAWVKTTLLMAKSALEIAIAFEQILAQYPEFRSHYQLHLSVLRSTDVAVNTQAISEIERLLWPVKITDADLTNISIPIKSYWAYLWFDEKLASQTLFGSQQERAFNREGVYFSAAHPPSDIVLPGRILWYVTKDTRSLGTQCIRACSRLDAVVQGKPKDLFRQFQHLGIYEWKDISSLVNGDLDREIVAYRFSETQLFENPVTYEIWRQITLNEKGKEPPVMSAAKMSKETFESIYKLGSAIDVI